MPQYPVFVPPSVRGPGCSLAACTAQPILVWGRSKGEFPPLAEKM